jgi:4-hydroxy-tetrahydrodipicolinate reductase
VIRVAIAGATGWTGRAIVAGVLAAADLELVAAVGRAAAGRDLGEALGGEPLGVCVRATVAEALDGVDVLVDYTSATAVKEHALAAVRAGVAVVVGSAGLTADDFWELDNIARERGVGVIASGNFSLTAAMAQAAALLVAPHLPHREIIDYADASRDDVPTGTARELAERLGALGGGGNDRHAQDIIGPREARGADVGGTPVHSVRLPGFSVSTEVVFSLPDERLTIRHDAGQSAEPYVAGTLLAARRAVTRVGVTRGLDTLILDRQPPG